MSRRLFNAYRVLATVVGCSIFTLIIIGVPLEFAHDVFPNLWTRFLQNGEAGERLGEHINFYLGTAHGWIYIIFFAVTLMMALKARWSLGFTVVTLLCGTVPILSFWAEARAIRRIRRQFPELGQPAAQPVSPPEAG